VRADCPYAGPAVAQTATTAARKARFRIG
jgi:hypothetical protein